MLHGHLNVKFGKLVFVKYIICIIVSIGVCVHFAIARQKNVVKRILKDAPYKSVDAA